MFGWQTLSRLDNCRSGITSRSPNIFSGFLLNYTHQIHTNATCTSHSDQISRSLQYVMLQNVKFFFSSLSLFLPDRRHLFSSSSVGQTAAIRHWQLASAIDRIYRNFFKICFWPHSLMLHWNFVLRNNYRIIF